MTNHIIKWGVPHLKAAIIASMATETVHRIVLRKNVLNEDIADDNIKLAALKMQSTLETAGKTLKGRKLGIVLIALNKNTNKEELLKSTYDDLQSDMEKLSTTNRQLQAWFPVNFASFQEWDTYSNSVKGELSLMVKEKLVA